MCFITIITDDISLVKLNEMCWLDLRCWHWRVVFCITSPFLEVRLPILLELLKRQRQKQNKDNGNDNDKYTGEQCFVSEALYWTIFHLGMASPQLLGLWALKS